MTSLFSRIPPLTLIVMMLAVGTVFIGYSITTTNIHNADTQKINEQTLRLVLLAIEQNNQTLNESHNIEKILNQQGNLSEERREALVVVLEDLPNVLGNITTSLQNLADKPVQLDTAKKVTAVNTTVTELAKNLSNITSN